MSHRPGVRYPVALFPCFDSNGRADRDRLEGLILGVTSYTQLTPEAPAQAELRPTCAGTFRVNLRFGLKDNRITGASAE
jgi:hypothetical protein